MLTAIEGHLVASRVQGLPAAGRAPGWGPGVCVGAGPGLHLFLQNQTANSTLELGVGEKQEEVRRKQRTLRWMEQARERLSDQTLNSELLSFLLSLCPSFLAAPLCSFGLHLSFTRRSESPAVWAGL